MMSEVLGLSHCKDYSAMSARWAAVEMLEQKSDTIFQWNPLQGSRIDWEGRKIRKSMLCYAKSLQSCPTLCDPMDCSLPGSSSVWDFPGKNTEAGCHCLLQGIFLTQVLNPRLLSPALVGGFFTTVSTGKPQICLG